MIYNTDLYKIITAIEIQTIKVNSVEYISTVCTTYNCTAYIDGTGWPFFFCKHINDPERYFVRDKDGITYRPDRDFCNRTLKAIKKFEQEQNFINHGLNLDQAKTAVRI